VNSIRQLDEGVQESTNTHTPPIHTAAGSAKADSQQRHARAYVPRQTDRQIGLSHLAVSANA